MSYMGTPFLLTRGRNKRLPAVRLLQALVKPSRQRGYPAIELQAQQLRSHLLRRQARALAKGVDVHRIMSHDRQQPRVGRRRCAERARAGGGLEARELGEYVVG